MGRIIALVIVLVVVFFIARALWNVIKSGFDNVFTEDSFGRKLKLESDEYREKIGAKYGFISVREYKRGKKIYDKIRARCTKLARSGERSYTYHADNNSDAEINYIKARAEYDGMKMVDESLSEHAHLITFSWGI